MKNEKRNIVPKWKDYMVSSVYVEKKSWEVKSIIAKIDWDFCWPYR